MNSLSSSSSKIEIRTNGFKASPSLKAHIKDQMERLHRHEPQIERIDIYLSKTEFGKSFKSYTCICKLAVPGPDLVMSETHDNLENAITIASHKLDRQIRKRSRKENTSRKSTSLSDLLLAS